MAGTKIRGITIELGADASGINKALKSVDTQLKQTQNNLKDINKLLKLDPGNTELLTQKQKNLESAVKLTGDRLKELERAQEGVAQGTPEWDALQREIIATEQDLKKAKDELKDFGSVAAQQCKAAGEKMKDFGSKVEGVGKKLSVVSGAAAGALTAIGKLGYDTMQSADELATLSQKTGLSTDTLQKWGYAAELVDVDLNSMTGALTKLKKGMGSGNAAFEKLGISITNADGSMRDAESVFYDALAALSQIDNETERDIVAMDLFGKSADELAGIIDDGGASLQEYGAEAENLGLIMSEDTIDTLNETNDTVDKLKQNVTGSLAQAGATLIQTFGPAIEKVSGLIGTITEKIRNLSPEQAEMIVKILGVVAAVGPLVLIIGKVISGVGSLLTIIPMLISPVGLVVAAIAALIAIGVTLYKHWDEIKAWAIKLKDKLVETWNSIVDSIKKKVDNLKDSIKTKFESIKDFVQGIVEKIKGIFNFQWSLPHLKLPHIVVGRYIEVPVLGTIPDPTTLRVDWYRKAYENPVMFSSPTVMATPNGYKGFGDGHGAEIVMGLDKLRELVGEQGGGVVINVYASEGQNVDELANKIQQKFVAMNRQRRAAGL